jgi:hypothetical protein
MQWIFSVLLAMAAITCIVLGLILSSASEKRVTAPRQQCANCGWTREQVQFCEFEKSRQMVVAPLCFECTIKLEAIPVRPRLRRRSGCGEIDPQKAGELALSKSH